MKRIFTLSAVFFTLYSTAQVASPVSAAPPLISTQTKEDITAKPSSLIGDPLTLKEMEFDFGKIPQGKPVTHVFDVFNNSIDSLKIVNVQASCGCTTPVWEQNKTHAPFAKTIITVGYNAAAAGPFTKFITITYNGTQSKQIQIKGEVWATPAASAPANKTKDGLD